MGAGGLMFTPSAASSAPIGAVAVPPRPRSWTLPGWERKSNPERIAVMRRIANEAANDPRFRRLAVRIFRAYGTPSRDYAGQAAAILHFLGDRRNVYFVNERDEVLQDPAYTLDLQGDGFVGPAAAGDCDDFGTTFAALCESVHLPTRLVTSGRLHGRPYRWIEGQGICPREAQFSHAYACVGPHPFRPRYDEKTWKFADATVPGAPLGWDVLARGRADPQRGAFGAPAEEVAGISLSTGLSLVVVSVVSAAVVRQLERAGLL